MGMIPSVSTEEIIPQVSREVSSMFSFEKGTEKLKVRKNIEFLISHLISLEILVLLFSILIPSLMLQILCRFLRWKQSNGCLVLYPENLVISVHSARGII